MSGGDSPRGSARVTDDLCNEPFKPEHRPKAFQSHAAYLPFESRSIKNESEDDACKVAMHGVQSKIRQQI
jgi:hypothetical protein